MGLRRVRGDNYCALRATLFQVFTQSTQLPSWLTEEDITQVRVLQLEGEALGTRLRVAGIEVRESEGRVSE